MFHPLYKYVVILQQFRKIIKNIANCKIFFDILEFLDYTIANQYKKGSK